ncbi:MAG: hypothetical protein H0X66_09040 [Verrucomicrobia bacterium]|nr:hypothetical protein [Verrucomicrobiota bacterium]
MLFQTLESEIISQIDSIVFGNGLLSILIGLAIPGGSLALFIGAQRIFPVATGPDTKGEHAGKG